MSDTKSNGDQTEGAALPLPQPKAPKTPTFDNDAQAAAYWQKAAAKYRERYTASLVEKERYTAQEADLTRLKSQVEALSTVKGRNLFGASAGSSETQLPATIPKLNNFNGKEDGDAYPYRRWRFDVTHLRQCGYPESTVLMSVIRSCRNLASDTLLSLGDDFTLDQMLECFDQRFLPVDTAESQLSKFYSAKQKADENVSSWGSRLECMLSTPQLQYLRPSQRMSMLRERFWRGLYSETMKNALRHRFDADLKFEGLLVAARSVEQEQDTPKTSKEKAPKAVTKSQTVTDNNEKLLKQILERIEKLEKDFKQFKVKGKGKPKPKKPEGEAKVLICWGCNEEGHYQNECPNKNKPSLNK